MSPTAANKGRGEDIFVYGSTEIERCVLLLSSKRWVLTDWMGVLPREVRVHASEEDVDPERNREGFARDLRV